MIVTEPSENFDFQMTYEFAQMALGTRDFKQAIKLSERGLEQAKNSELKDWHEMFDSLNSKIIEAQLILKYKGYMKRALQEEEIFKFNKAVNFLNLAKEKLNELYRLGRNEKKIKKKLRKVFEKINDLKQRDKINEISSYADDELFYNKPRSQEEVKKTFMNDVKEAPKSILKSIALVNEINAEDIREIDLREEEMQEEQQLEEGVDIQVVEEMEEKLNALVKETIEKEVPEPSVMSGEKVIEDLKEIIQEKSEINDFTSSHFNEERNHIKMEKISTNEKQKIKRQVINTLKENGFKLFPEKASLIQSIFNSRHGKIDSIALKIISVDESLNILLLIPIKICNLNGTVILADGKINYKSFSPKKKIEKSIKKILIKSNTKALLKCPGLIFDNLSSENTGLKFMRKYFKCNIEIEKTSGNNGLFFRNGLVQYKLIIDPVLICKEKVGFLEKDILFPIERKKNLHIIQKEKLEDLLAYLEKKYALIEQYSEDRYTIQNYNREVDYFIERIKWSSLPLIGFGMLFLLVLMFQAYFLLTIFIGLGYASIGIYCVAFAFLFHKFNERKKQVMKDFGIPHYKKPVKIEETDLFLIADKIPDYIEQFIYECYGKNVNKEVSSLLNEAKVEKLNSKKASEKEKENNIDDFGDDLIKKYGKFLED